jgi:hypothetical protein
MENFDININKISPEHDSNKPISSNSNVTSGASVSHSPLNLGGGATKPSNIDTSVQSGGLTAIRPAEKTSPAERVTGVKTFFTKLHAGAIEFLDEQITKWLKDNPDISIKRTNIVTGEIQGKKTEPNLIITVWY